MIFRQFAGSFPMPEHFETALPQAWAWTMLSPYVKSCPAKNPHIQSVNLYTAYRMWFVADRDLLLCPLLRFQIFPSLNVTNNPSIIDTTTNGTVVSYESGTVVYYPEVNANATTGGTQRVGNGTSAIYLSAVTHNRTSLSYPGRPVQFKWNLPGHVTGYDGKCTTYSTAGTPKVSILSASTPTRRV